MLKLNRPGIEVWIAGDCMLHSCRSIYVMFCLGDGMQHELLVRAHLLAFSIDACSKEALESADMMSDRTKY
jgi:hypothetical protein